MNTILILSSGVMISCVCYNKRVIYRFVYNVFYNIFYVLENIALIFYKMYRTNVRNSIVNRDNISNDISNKNEIFKLPPCIGDNIYSIYNKKKKLYLLIDDNHNTEEININNSIKFYKEMVRSNIDSPISTTLTLKNEEYEIDFSMFNVVGANIFNNIFIKWYFYNFLSKIIDDDDVNKITISILDCNANNILLDSSKYIQINDDNMDVVQIKKAN